MGRHRPGEMHDSEQQCHTANESDQDIGRRCIGSESGGAVHDGLAGGDPNDRGDCAEHRDEQNYRGERRGANSRELAA